MRNGGEASRSEHSLTTVAEKSRLPQTESPKSVAPITPGTTEQSPQSPGQAYRLVSVAFPYHLLRPMPVLKTAAFATAKVIPLLSMTIADAPDVTAFVHEWPRTL